MIKIIPLHHILKYHTGMQIDFNLYGMGLLRLGHVLFRHPVPTAQHTRHGWADSPVLAIPEGKPTLMLQSVFTTTPVCYVTRVQLMLHTGIASPASHSRGGQSNHHSNLTPGSAAVHSQASRLWTANDIPSQWLWSNIPAGARYSSAFLPFCQARHN